MTESYDTPPWDEELNAVFKRNEDLIKSLRKELSESRAQVERLRDGFGEQTKPTSGQIDEVITALAKRTENELLALTEAEISGQWYWLWEEDQSIEWNTYKFSDALEMYKRRCRRWEEHHNGNCCVVERVRDKYLMPRVRGFLASLPDRAKRDAGDECNQV